MQNIFAHSLPGRPICEGEPLTDHLAAVAARAGEFAGVFGWSEVARLAGTLHDIGKISPEFQAYIRGERSNGGDHSTAGADLAHKRYPDPCGRLLAAMVSAHHAGLANGVDLTLRLKQAPALTAKDWERATGPLPELMGLAPAAHPKSGASSGFDWQFRTRMLFSCLVDADFLETERFYAHANNEPIERGGHLDLVTLRDRLRFYMAGRRSGAGDAFINAVRARVLDHAVERAALPPGLFTFTAPTGSGKTLASLSFALEHATRHAGMRRVIYVIPFTSIIEQTASVFRAALNTNDDVLEHHATFDWETANSLRGDDEGRDALKKLRLASENWDAPIVVTTAVQFFESLFANRTSRCRKLHNIAGSVVILDEAQTLPIKLLRPCMEALDELARNYNVSIVLCTATQPALRKMDFALGAAKAGKGAPPLGFDIDDSRELAPSGLYEALKRVDVEKMPAPVSDATIIARFAEQPQMLCIVNNRAHAQALFAGVRDLPGACHLSTLMCPRHRAQVLERVRKRLHDGEPVRLISTSLIEAGVDISFPEVWRAAAGIDSIAQAAGRCNREGELAARGRVVVFQPVEATSPHDLKVRWEAANAVFQKGMDPLSLEAVQIYFRELYWQVGAQALDSVEVGRALASGGTQGILKAIRERAGGHEFPYADIAEAFRMIDDRMVTVIAPWRAHPEDETAEDLLRSIAAKERPSSADLRRLQAYAVAIPPRARNEWLVAGVLRAVHPAIGDQLLRFDGLEHYDLVTGVRLGEATYRDAESNVMG